MTKNEMINALNTIEELDKLWQYQDDEGLEEESDNTYKKMWDTFLAVAAELEKLTSGVITKKIAHTMVFRQSEKLRGILEKAA